MTKLQTKLNYIGAILGDINENFDTDLNFYYVGGGDTYCINSPYLKNKTFFIGSLDDTQKFVETLRDMFFNKDHIYEIKCLLDTYTTFKKLSPFY